MPYKLISYQGFTPQIAKNVFLAENVVLIGRVTLAANVNIWYNCVLRGDVDQITIGENTNIQDGTVIHTSRFNGPVTIGKNVSVGHMALLHACTIHDHAFIGMRATVMDNAIIEAKAFVAAGALVTPNKIVKSGEVWAGVPAKFMRHISDDEMQMMHDNYNNYLKLKDEYIG